MCSVKRRANESKKLKKHDGKNDTRYDADESETTMGQNYFIRMHLPPDTTDPFLPECLFSRVLGPIRLNSGCVGTLSLDSSC